MQTNDLTPTADSDVDNLSPFPTFSEDDDELNKRGWYNRRHDDAQAVIAGMLRDGGLEVHTGLVFNLYEQLRKPDLIAYNKEKTKCYCLDLRFRFEGDESSLQTVYVSHW